MSNWMIDVEGRFKGRTGMGGRRKIISSLLRPVGALLAMVCFGLVGGFIAVNFALGCETWDSSLWTATNSCVTPSAVINGMIGR